MVVQVVPTYKVKWWLVQVVTTYEVKWWLEQVVATYKGRGGGASSHNL